MQPVPPVISAKVFAGFEAYLEARGAALAPLLPATGIHPSSLVECDADLPLTQVSSLFELAAQETQDPCLGLHWAEAYTPGATGAFGYLILNAATLRKAMQAIARYLCLIVHPSMVSYEEGPDHGVLRWHLTSLTSSSTTQYVGFSVAAAVLRLRFVAGQAWSPLRVELAHRELPCSATARRIFGANVRYNASENAVYADKASLDRKSSSSDKRLFEVIEKLGEHLLSQRSASSDFVNQCQKAIIASLNHGEATLETTAEYLGVTARSVQTKLSQFGTTFDALLQDTRKELAIGYLRESDLTLTDIAMLLGFSELSAFSRATQRWFGMPPRVYRQELRRMATGSPA